MGQIPGNIEPAIGVCQYDGVPGCGTGSGVSCNLVIEQLDHLLLALDRDDFRKHDLDVAVFCAERLDHLVEVPDNYVC